MSSSQSKPASPSPSLASASRRAAGEGASQPSKSLPPAAMEGVPAALDPLTLMVQRQQLMARLFGIEAQPARLGRFVLLREIGRGAMGVVHAAYDEELDRKVALKTLHLERRSQRQDRFLREARALAKLSHPNIVQIHEVGTHEGLVYIAMELIDGPTLVAWAEERIRSWKDVLAVLIQAGRGLEAAHAAGLVHRDFKPENAIVGRDGRVRVLDFGLARERSDDEGKSTAEDDSDARGRGVVETLTAEGTVLGTPLYMAPEQHMGRRAGPLCDQYAFCVAAYELLFSKRPFLARTMAALLEAKVGGRLEPASPDPAIPRFVHDAIVRGLAPEPDQRWTNVSTLLTELERALAPRRDRWRTSLGVGAGAIAMGAVAVVVVSSVEPLPSCEVEGSALAGAWDDALRAEVSEAFAAGDPTVARGSLTMATARLDQWADAWIEARRAACVATRIDGVASDALLDRRSSCLARKRRELAGLVSVLARADSQIIMQTPWIVAELPDLGDCEEPPLPRAEAEPPDEPERRDAIDRAREDLSRARSLVAAGKVQEAEAIIEGAERDAERVAFVPLELEARATAAAVAFERHRLDAAAEMLRAVVPEAMRLGLDELAASASVQLAFGVAGNWSKPELEGWLVTDAEAHVARRQRDRDPLAARVAIARGRIDREQGRYDEALHDFERAAELWPVSSGEPIALRFEVADLFSQVGRLDEAEAELEAIVEQGSASWGPGSLWVGMATLDHALLDLERGRAASARERLLRAETVLAAALGPDSIELVKVELARARVGMVSAEYEAGTRAAERAVEGLSRQVGADHELTAQALGLLGALRFYGGDLEGSLEAYRRALGSLERIHGPLHPEVALIHNNIGESRLALGDQAGALEAFQRSLDVFGVVVADEHPWLALPLRGRGQVLLALGRPSEARIDLERALAVGQEGSDPRELAALRFALARALVASEGDPERARGLAQRARDELVKLNLREQVVEIDTWLDTHGTQRAGRSRPRR